MAKISGNPAKTRRVNAEIGRLTELFQGIESNESMAAQGLIRRAAWQRVELEDLEADIAANGWTEEFTQGRQSYMRERPEGKAYNALNKNFQTVMKQLIALLPKDSNRDEAAALMSFVAGAK